jgi:hypothetical protein
MLLKTTGIKSEALVPKNQISRFKHTFTGSGKGKLAMCALADVSGANEWIG